MTETPFELGWLRKLTDAPTLGTLIEQELDTRSCSRKEMAFALGMSYEKFQRVKADLDLPTGEELERIIAALHLDPVKVDRNVRASICMILWRTLYGLAKPSSTLRAARKRGTATDDAAQIRVEDLPAPIRRILAGHFDIAVDDTRGMATALKRKSSEEAEAHAIFIKGLAAAVELEGEELEINQLMPLFDSVTGEEDVDAR